MASHLVALLGGREVGRVRHDNRGRLSLVYASNWGDAPDAYPMSLSMPLAAEEHGPAVVEAFLWGLLPDNEIVLQRWAKKFQVSPRNAFALIAHVGEDCAGAVQFVLPERLEAAQKKRQAEVEWLNEHDIAERLRILREDHAAWRLQRDTGQFSLAGTQPKTALLLDNGRWGIPSGRTPTTHILKPPIGSFEGHAENEHICLALARAVGLPAATSQVLKFEKEIAIAVERYDRQRSGKGILRVHQEDTCQSLGIMPTKKYQNEGGPGVVHLVELLRTYSSAREEDVSNFVGAIGFNWLVAGTDAHAKNYSLLIAGGSRVRLAPLYDVASILPYHDIDLHKAKLAMTIGGEHLLLQVGLRQWQKLAREVRLDADQLIERIRGMAGQLPDAISDVGKRARADGLTQAIVERLAACLTERAKACHRQLADGTR
jgi:serine/threonine-protein kinase HipA